MHTWAIRPNWFERLRRRLWSDCVTADDDEAARDLVEDFAAQRFDLVQARCGGKHTPSVDTLRRAWVAAVHRWGQPGAVGGVSELVNFGGYVLGDAPMTFGAETVYLGFWLDRHQRVRALHFGPKDDNLLDEG